MNILKGNAEISWEEYTYMHCGDCFRSLKCTTNKIHRTRKILTLLIRTISMHRIAFIMFWDGMHSPLHVCACVLVCITYTYNVNKMIEMRDFDVCIGYVCRLGMRIAFNVFSLFVRVHDFIRARNVWRPNSCTSMVMGSQ